MHLCIHRGPRKLEHNDTKLKSQDIASVNPGPTACISCQYKKVPTGAIRISSSKLVLAGAGMPKPLTGAELTQNSLLIAADESVQMAEHVHEEEQRKCQGERGQNIEMTACTLKM